MDRPDWNKLRENPNDNDLVTVTRGTARLALTELISANTYVRYTDYTTAAQELAEVLGVKS